MPNGLSDGAIVIDTGLDNKGFIRDAAQFKRAVATLTQAVKTSGQQMAGGMNGYLKALQKAGGAAKAATGEQAALQKEIDKTAAAIRRMEERQEIARRKFEAGRDEAIAKATDKVGPFKGAEDYDLPFGNPETIEEWQERVSEAVNKVVEDYGTFEESAAFRNSSVDIEYAKEKLVELQAQMDELAGDAAPAAQGMAGGFANVAATARHALGVVGRFAGHAAIGFLKRLAVGAKNAAIQLAKLAGSAISGGMKKLGGFIGRAARSMLGFGKASKGAESGFGALIKRLLSFGAIIALLKKAFNVAKEGMDALAKSNPAVKGAVDSLRASLNGLKGSLATAFAPILTAAAPALTTLINMLTSAINAIGAFMAALTGQKTYQRAVSGLKATGGAASGAAGSVKKLNRELAGFDELNILGKSDTSGGGGGGGGGAGSAYSYETEEIASGITDFVQKLKDLWAAADYEGIGREIAGAINRAFAKARQLISWDTLGDKITQAVDAITGIFNGLVDGIDWDGIGRTFGTGINTILNTVNQLFTKINWANLGKKLAEGLNGLVDEVDWGLLGQTFANRINAVFGVLSGAVSSFNFEGAAVNLANAFNRLFTGIDWNGIAGTVSDGFNRVVNSIKTFVTTFRWGDAGTRFGKAVHELFSGINWTNLGETAASLIAGPLEALKNTIREFSFSDAAQDFADAVNGFFSNQQMWADAGTIVSESIKGLFTWGAEFLDGLDAEQIAADVRAFFKEIDWDGIAKSIWAFAISAMRKLGNLVLALIFGPDYKDKTKVQQEIEDYYSGLSVEPPEGRDYTVNFGLNLYADAEMDAFNQLSDAITNALETGNWVAPVGLDVPDESIEAARQEFIKEWKLINPEAPITPTLDSSYFRKAFEGIEKSAQSVADDVLTAAQTMAKGIKEYLQGSDLGAGEESLTKAPRSFWDEVRNLFVQRAYGDEADLLDPDLIKRNQKAVEANTKATKEGTKATDQTTANRQAFARLGGDLNGWDEAFNGDMSGVVVNAGVKFIPQGAGGANYVNRPLAWLQKVFAPGTDTQNRVQLVRNGFSTVAGWLGNYMGGIVNKGVGVIRSGFSTIASWITGSYMGGGVTKGIGVTTAGWTSIAAWIIGSLMGGGVTKGVGVTQSGWTNIAAWIIGGLLGGGVTKGVGVTQSGWKNVGSWITGSLMGGGVDKGIGLVKSAWTTVQKFVQDSMGGVVEQKVKLVKEKNNTLTWTVSQSKAAGGQVVMMAKAMGGIITAAGRSLAFASGGMLRGGHASLWNGVQKYASGTSRAHGSLFVAGEAGPEIIGHVNGRTEILNQSQLAQTMRSAVASGMLAALSRVQIKMPAMATGGVMPYEVSAQIAKSTADIQGTLNANNEDLIQTIISVAGQLVAALNRQNSPQPAGAGGLTAQQVINEINRQTLMFGASPLKGV